MLRNKKLRKQYTVCTNKKFGRTVYNMYKCIHNHIKSRTARGWFEQLLSPDTILRSTFLILYLKEDNVKASGSAIYLKLK